MHRFIPMRHHIEAKTGKKAADVVKMVVRDEQVLHLFEVKTRAP